jgi:hypothetical protein
MKYFRHGSPKNRHYAASLIVSETVMDWPPWRFIKNHHGLMESVMVLNCHGRARGLVSPAQTHFLWRKITVIDELPHLHGCLHACLHGWWHGYPSPFISNPTSKMDHFLAYFQPIFNLKLAHFQSESAYFQSISNPFTSCFSPHNTYSLY